MAGGLRRFGSDLGEPIGGTTEETTLAALGKGATEHFHNMAGHVQCIE